MEYLNFKNCEPQSEVNSVTSWLSHFANKELQLKPMVQVSQRKR